jgi:hypothetical protein
MLGGGADGFGRIVDAAVLPDNSIALLDAMAKEIRIVDANGRDIRRIGKAGNGPGELRSPLALETVGNDIIVLQNPSNAGLIRYSATGGLLSTHESATGSDLDRFTHRQTNPNQLVDRGPENPSLRLAATVSSGILQIGPAMDPGESQPRIPHGWLVRLSPDFQDRDTIMAIDGAELFIKEALLQTRGSSPVQTVGVETERLFGARTYWAVGPDWMAYGRSDSSRIAVVDLDNNPHLIITWSSGHTAITETNRKATAKWILATQALSSTATMTRFLGRANIDEGLDFTVRNTMFADSAPQFARIAAVQNCLLIAAFDPDASPDAVSLKWLAVDVRTGNVDGALSFEPRTAIKLGGTLELSGAGLLTARDSTFYFATTDSNGESFVEAHTVPALPCMRA